MRGGGTKNYERARVQKPNWISLDFWSGTPSLHLCTPIPLVSVLRLEKAREPSAAAREGERVTIMKGGGGGGFVLHQLSYGSGP